MTTALWLCLLVCCGAVEGFTEKSVDLGQNVTLECEVAVIDVLWFLMKPSEPPVFILRSFSSRSLAAEYRNTTFNKTFSLQYNGSLVIHNISADELGVYYCIHTQTGSPPISSGIGLHISNHSAGSQKEDPKQTGLLAGLIISVVINVALAVAVTVFTVGHCRRSTKTRAQPPDGDLGLRQDSAAPVYADVQLITTNGPVRTNNLSSTYALLKP